MGNGREKSPQVEDSTSEPAPRFTEATALATGASEATVQRDAARGNAIADDVLEDVVGTKPVTSAPKPEPAPVVVEPEPEPPAVDGYGRTAGFDIEDDQEPVVDLIHLGLGDNTSGSKLWAKSLSRTILIKSHNFITSSSNIYPFIYSAL